MKLANFSDGIDFYMLTKQFQRVAFKIEEIHKELLSAACNSEKAHESLKYYQTEKEIILSKMKDLLDRANTGEE